MPHKILLQTLAFFLIVLSGCSCERNAEKKSIKNVAYGYSYALGNYQVDSADKYASEETRKTTLVTTRSLMRLVDSTYIKSDTPATIRITDIKMTSDTTATAVWHKKTPRKKNSGTIELRKRNGEWQVYDLLKQLPARSEQQ